MKYQQRFARLTEKADDIVSKETNAGELKLIQEARRSRLLRVIQMLEKRDRLIVLSHCLGNQTIESVAGQLKITVAAARVAKTRALQRLKDHLHEEGADDV
jgi:DNA-directed RNA polymerase specialized sigma24 family protein